MLEALHSPSLPDQFLTSDIKGEDRVLSWDKRDESHSSDRVRAAKDSTVVDETPSKGKPKLLFKQSPKNAADDDPMHSYMTGSRDVQLQAKEELNFIGNAYYYKLKKQANCEQLDGEYTVVYTRPVGKLFGAYCIVVAELLV
jgi:hypothetical protein